MVKEPGFYWARLYGETMIVEVVTQWAEYQEAKTMHYGWQFLEDLEFISTEPLTMV